jgi:hypothetical protein
VIDDHEGECFSRVAPTGGERDGDSIAQDSPTLAKWCYNAPISMGTSSTRSGALGILTVGSCEVGAIGDVYMSWSLSVTSVAAARGYFQQRISMWCGSVAVE